VIKIAVEIFYQSLMKKFSAEFSAEFD